MSKKNYLVQAKVQTLINTIT